MTSAIQIMNEEEMKRACRAPDEDQSFGSLRTAKGHLPLRAMNVAARITGLAAEVTLEQTFENTLSEPIEATYIFPLPDRAGVTRFRMEVNGRVVEGEIKERGQARREYTEAIKTGHRAAITEEERPGVFTMRVGNLMPGERARIHLDLTGPLPYDEGEATFRFPLVVAPRYIPGQALSGGNVGDGVATDTDAVPDASRISPPVLLPGFPNPVRLSLSVELDPAGLPISDLRSSLHSVIASKSGERGLTRIELRAGERLNRDFVLRFKLGAEAVKTSLVLRPDKASSSEGAREGTFLLTLVPPVSLARAEKPRDVVFVLDRSGSMGGWKMVAARRAVARMVDTLRDKDNFAVFAFDDVVETPPAFQGTALVQATDRNRFRAVEFLAALEARNGTEMFQPLDTAVKMLAGGYQDRERIVVLVTDGQVGNEDQILEQLGGQVKNLRVFTLGIDRAVNEGFLKRLAALGGGLAEIVESEDRLDEVMDKIHRRIGTPLLTEMRVVPSGRVGQAREARFGVAPTSLIEPPEAAFPGLEVVADSIVPARIPDLFAGAPVFITGRYRGIEKGELTMTGRDALGGGWSEVIRAERTESAAITTLWARGMVRELEDRFVVGKGDRGQLERRIVDTSLRFGVLCRFTAFLAVDRAEIVNAGGQNEKVMQPVDAPDGWAMFEQGGGGGSGQGQGLRQRLGGMVRRAVANGAAAPVLAQAQKAGAVPPQSPAPMQASAKMPPPPAIHSSAVASIPGGAMADLFDADDEAPADQGRASESRMELEPVPPPAPARPAAHAMKPKPSPAPVPPPASAAKKKDARKQEEAERAIAGRESDLDLASYRRRAKEMLERLKSEATSAMSHGARLAALGILAAHLRTLIEDLRSVGAPKDLVDPLEILIGQLRSRLTSSQLGETEAAALWARVETVLDAFASAQDLGDEDPAPARDDFWKRI